MVDLFPSHLSFLVEKQRPPDALFKYVPIIGCSWLFSPLAICLSVLGGRARIESRVESPTA
ncbi:hypothetical protein N7495_009635 [Penicillium taxi]|uniref:uncharacterized protein n=1 Tax=Penicillium taxi TaxID=168475 RepID=UPI002544D40F|nr:uncharacterized protein N7495_009635 [Penicillium taxi]KAJ5885125.1 hypothetical protein N7495_009635 [Penicillium taxi]